MRLSIVKRRSISILVSLCMTFAALVPSFSHAVMHELGGNSTQISLVVCSTDGHQASVKIDAGDTKGHQNQSNHCPFCTLHVPLVISYQSDISFDLTSTNSHLVEFYQSPKSLIAWVKHPSQAPPFYA